MKRKDKREVAAFLKVIDFCGCNNCSRADDCQLSFSLMCNKGKSFIRGFLCGANWSDENPQSVIRDGKNTDIWHGYNEKPTRNCEQGFVVVTFADYIVYLPFAKTPEQFAYYVCAWNLRCWAYADEIMPPKDLFPAQDNKIYK